MRRISRFGWTVRFSVLAAAAFAMLVSAVACYQGPPATQESAVAAQRPIATPEPTATPELTATPEPTATPKPTPTPKVTWEVHGSYIPPCGRSTFRRYGGRAVKWSPAGDEIVFTAGPGSRARFRGRREGNYAPEVYAVGRTGWGCECSRTHRMRNGST